jgi:TatD DNase family protein
VLVDPHCHLDDQAFAPLLDEVVQDALEAGLDGALIPGYGPPRWERQGQLLRSHGPFRFWAAFGLHPWAVDPQRELEAQLDDLERGWNQHAVAWGSGLKAIGEFGLDRSPRFSTVPLWLQTAIFNWHLARARQSGLPLILHLVRADGAAMDLLAPDQPWLGVIHDFRSHRQMIPRFAEIGLCFSFGVGLLKSQKARDSLQATPMELMMFETDGPQGFPAVWGPSRLLEIAAAASQILGKSVEYLLARHRENCDRVFGFGAPSEAAT